MIWDKGREFAQLFKLSDRPECKALAKNQPPRNKEYPDKAMRGVDRSIILNEFLRRGRMHNTGLIKEPLTQEARQIVFRQSAGGELSQSLSILTQIDKAHIVMISEQRLVHLCAARKTLLAIRSLESSSFVSLVGREQIRGLYMLYESSLAEMVPAAADMHIGRSRNDINATAFLLQLRQISARLAQELLRLRRSIAASIERYGTTNVPVFSHRRPGMPGTWELNLSAFESALTRDFHALFEALESAALCPMGAGAGAGTEMSILPERTAELLGFRGAILNSLDAVASRDAGFRALAAAAIMTSTIGRVMNDFQVWYGEHEALYLPDNLVGASSIMPQKRNAFLLEHISGKCGLVIGSLTASLAASHCSAFANTVATGTEAMPAVMQGLHIALDVVTLAAITLDGISPCPKAFEQLATRGGVSATALAVRLRAKHDISFRHSHHLVGAALSEAKGPDPVQAAALALGITDTDIQSLSQIVELLDHGGGPGPKAADRRHIQRLASLHSDESRLAEITAHWVTAARALQQEVDRLVEA